MLNLVSPSDKNKASNRTRPDSNNDSQTPHHAVVPSSKYSCLIMVEIERVNSFINLSRHLE